MDLRLVRSVCYSDIQPEGGAPSARSAAAVGPQWAFLNPWRLIVTFGAAAENFRIVVNLAGSRWASGKRFPRGSVSSQKYAGVRGARVRPSRGRSNKDSLC